MNVHLTGRGCLFLAWLLLLRPAEAASALASVAEPSVTNPGSFAEQRRTRMGYLAESIDAGDAYPTPKGWRHLRRLPDAIAVAVRDGAAAAATCRSLADGNGPLAGHEEFLQMGRDLRLFRRPRSGSGALEERVADGRLVAARVQERPEVRWAMPVFVCPQSGLLTVPLAEVVVRLRPDVEAQAFFGERWPNVRPLAGTPDQFLLPLPEPGEEVLFAEVHRLAADRRVVWAEPHFRSQTVQDSTPNDPLFAQQWHLNNTGQGGGTPGADARAPAAWDFTAGRADIVIAIIDDSVEWTHADLAANIFTNVAEVAGNAVDDDGNGYVDDVHGWDFGMEDNDPGPSARQHVHGTACAGIAAAVGNNSKGVAGIAHQSRILPVKLFNDSDEAHDTASAATALYYAAGRARDGVGRWRGADVISISLTFPQSMVIDDALTWAATQGRGGKGCPIFASSGNGASAWTAQTIPNLKAGSHVFRFEFTRNATGGGGENTVWLDDVTFPGGQREDFEGSSFPPSGWTTGGNVGWSSSTRPDRVRGTGAQAAQAGLIGHSQSSWLRVSKTVSAGPLEFWLWTSTEQTFDMLRVYVDSTLRLTLSGDTPWNDSVSYPASHPAVMAVGASTDYDYRSDYSQFGEGLDFVAPSSGGATGITTTDCTGASGYNISSGSAGSYYSDFGGTSASAPLAAGIGALLLSLDPNLAASEVRAMMRDSCDKIGRVPYTNGWNAYVGFGRLNAAAALALGQLPRMTADDASVVEGHSDVTNAAFSIRLSKPSTNTVTVRYATRDGSALAESDYVATNGTAVFAPGTTNQTVWVRVRGDLVGEPDEVFFLDLSNPSDALLGSAYATCTITDDDFVAPVILTSPSSQTALVGANVTFGVAVTGTPPLHYQWWFNGSRLAAATNATLLLTGVTTNQAGSYFVTVSNVYGGVTSTVAGLMVHAPVDIGFHPAADAAVSALAVQPDGRILAGGVFTTLAGQPRNYLARLNEDGTLDNGFNPGAGYRVFALAVQPDGKILAGGAFTVLGGQQRHYLGRLNADGTLDDGFNPGADAPVHSLAVQPDGKILVGGEFTTLGGQARSHLGRLNPDGTVDSGFDSAANQTVLSLAVQADGKILVGGGFTLLGEQPRNYIGRLHADGALDAGFHPGAGAQVHCLAPQASGRTIVAGAFTTFGGQPRNYIARLNEDGTLDREFNPGAGSQVFCLAAQADGRILAGGSFLTLAGQPRSYIGRLNEDGTLDDSFNPGADSQVHCLAGQMDGKILVGGSFETLGGERRLRLGRLLNTDPATQEMSYDGSTVTWLRGGSSPEVWNTTVEQSTDGVVWVGLGAGTRVPDGWRWVAAALPPRGSIRARGHVTSGLYGGSSWFVETVLPYPPSPSLQILLNDGGFGVASNRFGFNFSGTPGQVVLVEGSTDLRDWHALSTNTLGPDPSHYADPESALMPWRFYRLRQE